SVFMPELKEPQWFAHDFPDYGPVKERDEYLGLFASADPRLTWGEASVWYLYSRVAVSEIARVRPDAKIIILLRNPVRAAASMHAQLIIGLVEDIYDFQDAWRAQTDRSQGRRIPLLCPEPSMLLYGAVFSYAKQVARVLDVFPADQVKIVIYEELFGDTLRT